MAAQGERCKSPQYFPFGPGHRGAFAGVQSKGTTGMACTFSAKAMPNFTKIKAQWEVKREREREACAMHAPCRGRGGGDPPGLPWQHVLSSPVDLWIHQMRRLICTRCVSDK